MVHQPQTTSKIEKEENFNQKSTNLKLLIPILIKPKTIIFTLVYTVVFVFGFEVILLVLKYSFNYNSGLFNMIEGFFDFNKEANFPTLISTILLLFASTILFFIYKAVLVKKIYWLFLSALFMFLCLDEAAQIHEKFDKLKSRIDVLENSSLAHAWVLPYLALIIFVIIFLKGFLLSLPYKTKNLFILSGAIFVFGAIGLEIIQGQLSILSGGHETLTLDILYCIEELCEMSGVILFIWALLKYIAPNESCISITIT